MARLDMSAVLSRYTMPTVLSGVSGETGSSTENRMEEPLTSKCSTAPVAGMLTSGSVCLSLARFHT
jgi:hypothetical protein